MKCVSFRSPYRSLRAHQLQLLFTQRPSAEELAKTKWIKATKGTPVSYLRELLKIYDAWAKQGGSRASLAGDYDWDDDLE